MPPGGSDCAGLGQVVEHSSRDDHEEINDLAAKLMADMGVKSAFLGYRGYQARFVCR